MTLVLDVTLSTKQLYKKGTTQVAGDIRGCRRLGDAQQSTDRTKRRSSGCYEGGPSSRDGVSETHETPPGFLQHGFAMLISGPPNGPFLPLPTIA